MVGKITAAVVVMVEEIAIGIGIGMGVGVPGVPVLPVEPTLV